MRYFALIFIFALVSAASVSAQIENNPLGFMVGHWEGSGWMMTQDGKQFTHITEDVACKIECEVLAVEGLGTQLDSVTNKETVVHDAYGTISKDPATGKWQMRAYKKGDVIDTEIEFVRDKVIQWKLPIPHSGGTMRFTTDFTAADQWRGKGEYSRDGQNWMLMMETALTRVKY